MPEDEPYPELRPIRVPLGSAAALVLAAKIGEYADRIARREGNLSTVLRMGVASAALTHEIATYPVVADQLYAAHGEGRARMWFDPLMAASYSIVNSRYVIPNQ